jgi:hypothetical protein
MRILSPIAPMLRNAQTRFVMTDPAASHVKRGRYSWDAGGAGKANEEQKN